MLLEVEDLHTEFALRGRPTVLAVRGVSFGVERAETLGLVGESGSGKSVTALSIARLITPPGRTTRGSVKLDSVDLLPLSEKSMRSVRGAKIAFVFQDPMTALNPVLTIGTQITETIRAHKKVSGGEARKIALEWLERVHIALPEHRFNQYPYELSGGMRQRVMLAIAFSCEPDLLIADEPTTALDVTVQAQILDIIEELKSRMGAAVLLITHDMSIVAEKCDRVIVMYAGQIVEESPVAELFGNPCHPYTRALLRSVPDVWAKQESAGHFQYLAGQPPRLIARQIPGGCAFNPRCPERFARCTVDSPSLYELSPGKSGRCLLLEPGVALADNKSISIGDQ